LIWVITIIVFLGLLAVSMALQMVVFKSIWERQAAARKRLKELESRKIVLSTRSLRRDHALSTIPLLHRLLAALPQTSDLQLMVQQAGNPCNLGTLVLACLTLGAAGLAVGAWRDDLALGGLLAVVGLAIPVMWLKRMRASRLKAFDEQFPEVVDLLARALRAGHSFGSALRMVGEEMENPAAGEFSKTFDDYTYGKVLEDSLYDLVKRVGLQDVKFFVTAVVLQKETGGNLAEILDSIGSIIRDRFRLMRQVRALSAEGRLSGLILSLLAPGLLLMLWLTTPSYVAPLFDHPMGRTMLMTGMGFQMAGMLVIRKLVNVKV
jgi:tight adherence protein B